MAMLLTKGMKKNASPDLMRDFISRGWRDELKEHFEMEESVLIPALEKTLQVLNGFINYNQKADLK